MIGRVRELKDLSTLVETARTRAVSTLLLGEMGIGKTTLLRAAAGVAQEQGFRVRELDAGRPGEWGLPLGSAEPADALLALDRIGAGAPVLLVLDGAERAGREPLSALTRIMRDACAEPVGLLLAARGSAPPEGLGADIARYRVGPLDDCSAARLVTGRGPRQEILRRAAGNPLALLAVEPPAEFLSRVRVLPPVTRRLLLHAAVADEHLTVLNLSGGGSADLRDWQPAEAAGLVAIGDGRVRFGHPLIRAACLAVARESALGVEAEIRQAHGDLAAVTGNPYYRALASDEPDEQVAASLEQARERRDFLGEARTLVAAAERSPAPDDAARRYAKAVVAAYRSGEPEWTLELHRRVAARTDDPDLLGLADAAAGLALIHSGRLGEAFDLARHAAHRQPRDGQLTMAAVAVAANAALLTGVAAHRDQLPGLLDLVTGGPVGGLGDMFLPVEANPATRAWIRAVADPYAPSRPLNDDSVLTGRAEIAWTLGTSVVAWLRDDSARAAAEMSALWQAQRSYGAIGALAVRVPAMILAMIDGGRWADAAEAIDEAETLAAAGELSLLLTALPSLRAMLAALRGDPATVAGSLGNPATPSAASTGDAFTESLRRRAAGLTALASSDYEKAYWHFRAMFDVAGEPVHYFLGPRSLPQLAVAAGGVGRRGRAQAQVRRILHGCRRRAGRTPTPRMAMLLSHAAALLDDGDETEEHFHRAVGDPDSAPQWPLELAEAQLNFALWLRRQRRVVQARPLLLAALDTFARLGAGAHADQARRHLPGGALLDEVRPVTGDAFAALTAQKQTIARLAAEGMSNREIAGRLFLSPRTIGSHLYDIYPLLGVSNRHQLRVLLAGAAT